MLKAVSEEIYNKLNMQKVLHPYIQRSLLKYVMKHINWQRNTI